MSKLREMVKKIITEEVEDKRFLEFKKKGEIVKFEFNKLLKAIDEAKSNL